MDLEILHHLPADALDQLAQKREQEARDLRTRAREMRTKDAARASWERQMRDVDAVSKMVVQMVEYERKSYDAAIHAASVYSGLSPLTVEFHLNKFMKKKDRRAMLVKDAAVMGMLRAGLSNQEIAGRLHIHPNTVSNIKAKVMNP